MKIERKSCLKIGVSIFLLYLCIHYWSGFMSFIGALIGAAAPLLIGCVIAYIINILMSFYERHYFPKSAKKFWFKSRRPVCMLAAFVSLVVAVILLIYIVVLQQLEGNLIYPRVVGSSMGLPGIWVLAAVTVAGGVMGIAGMLIGVPLAATVYRLLQQSVNKMPAITGGEQGDANKAAEESAP